jgi:hypothetical protein
MGHSFEYNGLTYSTGDELDVPDDAALGWLQNGMVLPADGAWPKDWPVTSDPSSTPAAVAGSND